MSETKLEVAFNEEYTGDCESPEWKLQLELPYLQELHDSGCGYFSDLELYEIAIDWFKYNLKMRAEDFQHLI